MKISKAWKAVVAGAAAGGASLTTALDDGTITAQEGITAAVALIVALAVTYRVPNKQVAPTVRPASES